MVVTAELKGVIRLQQGSRVKVHGLESRSDLNGSIGHCLQFDAAKMRWGVELADGKKIALKLANLLPLDAQVSPAAPGGPGGAPIPVEPAPGDRQGDNPATATTDNGVELAFSEVDSSTTTKSCAAEAMASVATPVNSAASVPCQSSTTEKDATCGAPAVDGTSPARPIPEDETAGALGLEGALSQEAEALPRAGAPAAPRTGRWFQNEAAAEVFAEQLLANDPTLKSLCLVPPKRFAEDDVERICTGLEANSHCLELVASGHALSGASCKRLAQMLAKNTSLQLLSVGDSSLGDAASVLFEGLGANTSLTSLDLELKGLTPAAGLALANALTLRRDLNAPRVETLRLSRNSSLREALAQLASSPAPRELLLCDCGFGRDFAADIGRWAASGVEDLDLRDNSSLGADGLEDFLQALGPTNALRRLRLDGCAVGDDGLEALAAAKLELEELFLERCELTSDGCEHLERMLLGHRLRHLSVRTNLVEDTGCRLLAGCTERLDLAANNISQAALGALGEQPLVCLELFNNPLLGPSVSTWCAELDCAQWQQLEQLDLSGCLLGNEGFRCICGALKERPSLMPRLKSLCLGGNEVEDSDELNDLAESLAEARGGHLRLVWKNT